jgi:predicted DNA-binding protein
MRTDIYAKNLHNQIKLRLDEDTLRKITEISDKTEQTKSLFLRDLIITGLSKLYKG